MWKHFGLWTHLTARIRVFTAGMTSSTATSQYDLSSVFSSPTPSTKREKTIMWETSVCMGQGFIWAVCLGVCTCESRTICSRARFQPQGSAKASSIVKTPALLHLSRTGGFRYVLIAWGLPHTSWWYRGRNLAPECLSGAGTVHLNAVTKSNLPTARKFTTLYSQTTAWFH